MKHIKLKQYFILSSDIPDDNPLQCVMETSYRLLFARINIVDIVYNDFIGQLFSPRVIVVFGFSFESIWASFGLVSRVDIESSWSRLFSTFYLFCCILFTPISKVG